MKYLKGIFFLLLMAMASGCSGENEGAVLREFFSDRTLALTPDNPDINFRLDDGENLVFRYSLIYPENPDISDDEISDVFWFEIPAGASSFSYNLSQDNTPATLFFQRVCFCGQVEYTFNSVNITATRLNAVEWQVEFDMEAQDNFNTVYPLRDVGIYELRSN